MISGKAFFRNIIQYCNWILIFLTMTLPALAQESKPVLSSRWFHPINKLDTLSTIDVIEKMKPVRLDWTYCDDPAILKKYTDLGIIYSLTLNPQVPDSLGYTTSKMRIKTLNGKPYVASWMKGFKIPNPYWGCVNNPDFFTLFLNRSIQLIKLNPYALMVDDALFNVQLQNENFSTLGIGCVCRHCLNGFRIYLRNIKSNITLDNNFIPMMSNHIEMLKKKDIRNDKFLSLANAYKKYQRESVVSFLKKWKWSILKVDKDIKILTNNYKGSWNDIYSIFDGGIAELAEDDLTVAKLDILFKNAGAKNKSQQFTLASSNKFAQNYLLAYLILNKKDYLIPWDVFAPSLSNSTRRYYADLNEYKSFAEFLKDKNTIITIKEDGNIVEGNKWYRVVVDKNTKLTYVILNKYPLGTNERLKGILWILLSLLSVGFLILIVKKLVLASKPGVNFDSSYFKRVQLKAIDVK